MTCMYSNLTLENIAPTFGSQTCYIALTVDKKNFVLNVSYNDVTLMDTYSSKISFTGLAFYLLFYEIVFFL